MSTWWAHFWAILSVASAVERALAVVAIIIVLRRPREPRAMLAWILALILLPVVGLVLFVLIGEPRFQRARRRRRRRRLRLHPYLSRKVERIERKHARLRAPDLDPGAAELMTLATKISGRTPTTGNRVTIYHEDEQNFNAILAAVEQAHEHIHLEYYIFQPDQTGRQLQDLLVAKARAGLEVRLLVDYIGCWHWPREFQRRFTDNGVKVTFFMPMIPLRGRLRVNFRNHRKILIVDGRIGFTGSQNIGDEYRGRLAKYGPWRDTHMQIVGPAVHQMQEIFVEDWYHASLEDLVDDAYFPDAPPAGDQTLQVIASGPDSDTRIMHHLFMSAVSGARNRIAVLTPYFAPDTAMLLALQSAAFRGVRVQLLIPSCSNHRVTLWAGRSFYKELSDAGVEVYEYDKVLLHSKVMVVDDAWAMVGSANMDQRSFRINFEVTTLLYDSSLADDLQADFDHLLADARRMPAIDPHDWSFGQSVLLGLARLATPLL